MLIAFAVFFLIREFGNKKAEVLTENSSQPSSVSSKIIAESTAYISSSEGTTAYNDTSSALTSAPKTENEKTVNSSEPLMDYKLSNILDDSGYTADSFKDSYQLITVTTSGNSAVVNLFDKIGTNWSNSISNIDASIGKNGVNSNKKEGDKTTPAGLFSIGKAFYIDSPTGTKLDEFKITEDTYWVDDVNSQFYNQHVEGTENKDWNSAEHMIDYYASYKYGFVINYNTNPIINGNGSAIFFHCFNTPTSGCISVADDDMLSILQRLDSAKNPMILIY